MPPAARSSRVTASHLAQTARPDSAMTVYPANPRARRPRARPREPVFTRRRTKKPCRNRASQPVDQSPLFERLGVFDPVQLAVEFGEVLQALGHVEVVLAEGLFPDRWRSLEERLGLGVLAVVLENHPDSAPHPRVSLRDIHEHPRFDLLDGVAYRLGDGRLTLAILS